MKTVYFIFKNMKEAEYYCKELAYCFQGRLISKSRNPYSITLIRYTEKPVSFISKILIKLGLKEIKFEEEDIKIIFKSEKSDFTGIRDEMFHFSKDEYDISYFEELIMTL